MPGTVLFVASVAVFMAFLDDTVVSIAFPSMLHSFRHATIGELAWVFNAYNIAFAAALVPAGRLADLLGRRRLFTFGVTLFTTASVLCALAPAAGILIAARALQGIAAGALVPASLALVMEVHAPAERVRAVGVWSATAAVAAGVGPAIGGLLVYIDDWRLVFLINVPIGAAARYLGARKLVESRAPGRREVPDIGGALLLASGVCTLALAVTEGPVWGWTSPGAIAAALAAIACAVAFVRRFGRRRAPIVDRDLLRAAGFATVSGLTLVGSAGFLALGIGNVLFLMQVWHYSALTAGLALTPAPFVAAPAALLAGRAATRRDPRKLVSAGAVVLAAGAAWLALRMGREPDYLGAYLPGAILVAIGIGLSFPLVSDAAASYAPHGQYAGATGVNTALRLIGGAFGVALLAALLGHSPSLDTLAPFQRAWTFAAVCFAALAGAALALPRFKTTSLETDSDQAAPAPRGHGLPETSAGRRPRSPRPSSPTAASTHELLAGVSLFANLSQDAISSLASSTTTQRLRSGEWLFRQGSAPDAMYVLRSGRLEVLREDGTGTVRIRELGVGSAVGELALLSGADRSASVRCRRDAELIRLSQAGFVELLETADGFAASVSRALARELQRSSPIDAEPSRSASTIAIVADDAGAERSGLEDALLRELQRLGHVAHVSSERVAAAHPDAAAGVALARTLDVLEKDHDTVLISATGRDPAWSAACMEQADRTLLLVSGGAPLNVDRPPRRCDVVLLAPVERDGVSERLAQLDPRSTHPVRAPTFEGDVARLARRLRGCAIGLVLSGGGARAFAHLGVIEALEQSGVVIDRVGGTSMGAFIGALLAKGMDAQGIDAHCYEEWVWRNPFRDYGLPRHSLFRGRRLRAMLEGRLVGTFEELPLPFYCTAVDVVSSELVVQDRGDLPSAVAASMAVPGVLPAVIREDRLLLDGAVVDGLPVSVMAAQDEGPIIASDVTERALRRLSPAEQPRLPSLMETLANLAFLTTADTAQEAGRHADLLILPDHESVGALEFHMLDSLRDAGRRAALAALEQAPLQLPGP